MIEPVLFFSLPAFAKFGVSFFHCPLVVKWRRETNSGFGQETRALTPGQGGSTAAGQSHLSKLFSRTIWKLHQTTLQGGYSHLTQVHATSNEIPSLQVSVKQDGVFSSDESTACRSRGSKWLDLTSCRRLAVLQLPSCFGVSLYKSSLPCKLVTFQESARYLDILGTKYGTNSSNIFQYPAVLVFVQQSNRFGSQLNKQQIG